MFSLETQMKYFVNNHDPAGRGAVVWVGLFKQI